MSWEVKRQIRRKFSSEEMIRIVLEGMKGESSIAELCCKENIYPRKLLDTLERMTAFNWSDHPEGGIRFA